MQSQNYNLKKTTGKKSKNNCGEFKILENSHNQNGKNVLLRAKD